MKRLAKHTDKRVAQLAVQVVDGWKRHFEKKLTQPLVDVHCDLKTEALRQTARRRTISALMSDESSSKQVSSHLRCVFCRLNPCDQLLFAVCYSNTRGILFNC